MTRYLLCCLGKYWGNIRDIYWGYMGIMEENMETTMMCLGCRETTKY